LGVCLRPERGSAQHNKTSESHVPTPSSGLFQNSSRTGLLTPQAANLTIINEDDKNSRTMETTADFPC
jgi:hypothetical protein